MLRPVFEVLLLVPLQTLPTKPRCKFTLFSSHLQDLQIAWRRWLHWSIPLTLTLAIIIFQHIKYLERKSIKRNNNLYFELFDVFAIFIIQCCVCFEGPCSKVPVIFSIARVLKSTIYSILMVKSVLSWQIMP